MSGFDPIRAQTAVKDVNLSLTTLLRRQRRLYLLALVSLSLMVLALFLTVIQQQLVLSFWDLSRSVEQLHIPATVDLTSFQSRELPHYFERFLSWLGWLFVKAIAVLIGGFLLIRLLKHFGYFQRRFKSLVLKFVAWLICCILIWSSLSYIQYRLNATEQQSYYMLLSYDHNIQESVMAQQLAHGRELEAVKAYLLAQTALLHDPVDKAAAQTYMQQLLLSEQSQPYFASYGFKPEQLWAMQQQLYGKSISPTAQQLDIYALKAEKVSIVVKWLLYAFAVVALISAMLSYLFARNIQQRCLRIQQLRT